MLTLVEQAQEKDVEANFATRTGRFREELVRYLEETRPATLVLGSSKPGTAYLDADKLDRLVQEIEEQTGVPVELIQVSGRVVRDQAIKVVGPALAGDALLITASHCAIVGHLILASRPTGKHHRR